MELLFTANTADPKFKVPNILTPVRTALFDREPGLMELPSAIGTGREGIRVVAGRVAIPLWLTYLTVPDEPGITNKKVDIASPSKE